MALPTLITVSGTIRNAAGPVAGRLVWVRSSALRPASAADPNLGIPEVIETVVPDTGEFSQQIYSTNDPAASPTGWTWEVRPHFEHWHEPFTVAIPYDSPGAALSFNQIAPVPADGTGDLYALANHTHVGGGSGPDPSNTVTAQTTYGASSTAGNSDLYSRANHAHGTPSLPTASDIGAATTAALTAHADDTTGVHGIADTSALVLTGDSRLSNARTPTAHAASHADGGTDEVSVDASQVVSGTLGIARIPTGSTGSTVSLGNHTHEGGGTSVSMVRGVVSSGDITPQNTGSAWQPLTGGPTLTIPAAVGDYISVEIMGCLMTGNSSTFYDLAVSAGGSLVRYGSTGTGAPATEGDPSLYHDPSFKTTGTVMDFVAEAGDIDGGNVTAVIAVKSGGAGKLFAGAAYPFRWRILNYGAL